MEEVFNFFNKLTGDFEFLAFGAIGLIIILLLILMFTGRKKKTANQTLLTGKDLNLDEVMGQLRNTSDNVQSLITEYRAQAGTQEKLVIERQMQVQKLEEQIHQMQGELQLLDDAPPELRERIEGINEQKTVEFQRKRTRNNYSMLIIGFLLGIVGLMIGRYFANNTELVLSWLRQLGQ